MSPRGSSSFRSKDRSECGFGVWWLPSMNRLEITTKSHGSTQRLVRGLMHANVNSGGFSLCSPSRTRRTPSHVYGVREKDFSQSPE